MVNKNPQQLNFPFALWTAAMVRTLIAERFNIGLSHSSVCRLLNQLGLTAQRPLWRAYQQSPETVKRWLETDYPSIRRRAKRQVRRSSSPTRRASDRTITVAQPGGSEARPRWSPALARGSAPT